MASSRAGVWLIGSLLFGCAAERDRPPGAEGACTGAACIGSNSQGGSGGTGGGAGGSGAAGADAGASTLSGSVSILNEALTGASPFLGVARVTAEAAGSGFVEIDTQPDGTFELEGVTTGAGWVGVQAPGEPDLLPTLQPMFVSAVPNQDLLLFRASALELFIASANSTVVPESNAGHVLIHVVDSLTEQPKPFVSLASASGAQLVLYDDGPVFGANIDSTGTRGYIFLVNVPLSGYPGQLVSVTLTDGVEVLPVEFRAAQESVTVFDLLW